MSLNSSRSYRTVVLTVKLSKFFLKAWFHAFLPFVLVVVFCVLLGYYMHCCAICDLRCPTRKKSEFAVLSAMEKDPHILCPSHTGWQCSQNQRCDVCKEWSEDRMLEHIKLQEGTTRRKVSKEKQRL